MYCLECGSNLVSCEDCKLCFDCDWYGCLMSQGWTQEISIREYKYDCGMWYEA